MSAPKCSTCGRAEVPAPGAECAACVARWKRARSSRAFLPTVPLPLDFSTPAGEPGRDEEPEPIRPGPFVRGQQLNAFDLDLFTT